MKPPKKLQQQWERKLKASGFDDIEKDEYSLKEYHSYRFVGEGDKFFEKQRYYELASQLLHTYPFKNPTSKAVWRLHCEGNSILSIMKTTGVGERVVEKLLKNLQGHFKSV